MIGDIELWMKLFIYSIVEDLPLLSRLAYVQGGGFVVVG